MRKGLLNETEEFEKGKTLVLLSSDPYERFIPGV